MPDPKGFYLYVNVGASEARRRLKGVGHGVRKIQSAGRGQAVIIHTATGRHRAELERLFADVGYSSAESDLGEPIDNLRNLGATSSRWLRDAGIRTVADLQRIGPVRAFQMVKQQYPSATLNLLWALAAGLADLDWRELPQAHKDRLLNELKE